ncbi:hypothetical protein RCL1_002153 [Eukaryota sp. TZLM3-RCL]
MDDIFMIGTRHDLGAAAAFAFQEFNKIGLSLNAKKCLMIGRTSCNFLIDSQPVTFVNYRSEAFRFLGCFLGDKTNKTSIAVLLTQKLESINSDEIAQLEIQLHLKFFILKICYSGKVPHLLRSTSPELSLPFFQSFNQIRTEFLSELL